MFSFSTETRRAIHPKHSRHVYDMFVARFEWLAKVITFDMFSMMVDEALEQMRTMLDSNEAVQKLIANEAGEGSE